MPNKEKAQKSLMLKEIDFDTDNAFILDFMTF